MHIPDGFTSDPVNTLAGVVSAIALSYSAWAVNKEMKNKTLTVSLMATVAAFIFAMQMLNFPIGGGTSGHFLGAVLAAALLGPWGACLVMAAVLGVQAFAFGDGGIAALGANILNMSVLGGIVAFYVMRGVRGLLPAGRGGELVAIGATSWLSIIAASAACAVELAVSGTSPMATVVPAMVGTHALIGLGEVALTLIAVMAVARFRSHSADRNEAALAGAGLVFAVLLALFASPFASTAPDGLERVAADYGFLSLAVDSGATILSGLSVNVAGLVGTLLVFGVVAMTGRAVIRGNG